MTKKVTGYTIPEYPNDAIFHYTNADGLLGILSSGNMWSTAYFTTNDATEMDTGEGVLTQIVKEHTHQLQRENHEYVDVFRRRGVDIHEYANKFENFLLSFTMGFLCFYITCFYRVKSKADFNDGLLSQWRGYGSNGGYALQFSRTKLMEWTEETRRNNKQYDCSLNDVHYNVDNPIKNDVLEYEELFLDAYMKFLNNMLKLNLNKQTNINSIIPLTDLFGGALKSFLFYRLLTKNRHFSEERECRMSILVDQSFDGVQYFNRNGLIVPYIKTPQPSISFLNCIESIIVGPGAYQDVRRWSVAHLIQSHKLGIDVRLSSIPYNG